MTRRPLLVASALATLLLAGCADAPTTPTRLAAAPRTSTAAGSSNGALIIRDQVRGYFFVLDTDHGLLSIHMPVWDLWLCGGSSYFNLVERTRIYTPSQIQQFLAHITDNTSSVGIYRATSYEEAGLAPGFDLATFCAFIASNALVAQGTVHHVQNLSNASFSAQWGGQLTGVDGQTYTYSEAYQLTADAHDPADATQWVEHVTHIMLRPIGH